MSVAARKYLDGNGMDINCKSMGPSLFFSTFVMKLLFSMPRNIVEFSASKFSLRKTK